MEKKFIVWSGISLFVLMLALTGCERGERDEDEREREQKAASPSSTPGAGAVTPAPSGGEASPGATYGTTPPAEKQ